MAIDLTNPESRQGAADALTVLIKSKYGPIVVTKGSGGGSGPQLTPPKNIEVRDSEGNPVPPEQQDPQEPQKPQDGNGSGEDKPQTKVTKTGGGAGKDTDNEPQDKDNKGKDGSDGKSGKDGQDQDDSDGSVGGSQGNADTGKGKGENSKLNKDSSETANGKRGDLFDKEKNAKTMAGIKDDAAYKQEKEEKARQDAQSAWDKLINGQKAADFSELEDDLYYAIAAQVEENANIESGWSKGSKAWADAAGALAPKDLRTEPRRTKPLIYVFFDQSGSFGQPLIDRGKSVLKCLDDFIQNDQIMPPKLFIFGDRVEEIGSGNGYVGGGTGGWPQCMNIIKKAQDLPLDERCTNVLVLSDRDIEGQTDWYSNYNPRTGTGWKEIIHIEGAVFWCWANNSRARKAEEHLIGEMGNFRYKF